MYNSYNNVLTKWLSNRFNLPTIGRVSLLRAHTNDVCLIEAGDQRFVLKLYGTNWRTDSEIRYEIDLLEHLHSRNVSVALPITGSNDDALQHIDLKGQRRQAVLFDHAAGAKPEPPLTREMYHRQGRAAAALHRAADDFATSHHRQPLDLDHLIDQPLALISSLDVDAAIRQALHAFGESVRASIEDLATGGLDWGPCHGDLTFDNVHVTDGGETVWYDFDSGGPGWRAIDLQGWAAWHPDRAGDWQAFLDGYREARPLSECDIVAAPYLALAQGLWSLQVELERRLLAQGQGVIEEWLAKTARRLCAAADVIGLGA